MWESRNMAAGFPRFFKLEMGFAKVVGGILVSFAILENFPIGVV